MPIHDWTRVDAGLFHDFHQDWTIELRRTLNAGRLPPGYIALVDQSVGGLIPDVLTLNRGSENHDKSAGGVALATAPPMARFIVESEGNAHARRANRIRIQHRHGEVVAVIEIVSPGKKSSQTALRAFVRKTSDLIWQGIHVLVVDLFPPSDRDPQGIHKAIWDEVEAVPFELPPDKPLVAAAYRASATRTAYVEPLAVGDALPQLPIFLTDNTYVPAPLEVTYQASWEAFPSGLKDLLRTSDTG
jgi:hypothetical protein